MSNPPTLTDRSALRIHRSRAAGETSFLHDLAMDEVKDRLSVVNRAFKSPAIVTGFPKRWENVIHGAELFEDTDILALSEGNHDLIVHAMCLHWANDPVGQMIQCRRALKPDGLLIALLFAGQTLHELRACLAEAEIATHGGLSPRVAPMADLRDLGDLMQRAGLALPVADMMPVPVNYRDLDTLFKDLRTMGETNALAGRTRRFASRAMFADALSRYRASFRNTDGTFAATFEIAILTGWGPDPSQPRPLRPGSAVQRLADALDTTETPLPD